MLRTSPTLATLRHTLLRAAHPPAPSRLAFRLSAARAGSRQQQRLISTRTRIFPLSHIPRWPRQRLRGVRWDSSKPPAPVSQTSGSQGPRSVSDRFKELSRKYGWAAVGVYLGLSVLDFPFCFLAVRLIGPERIGEAEHAVVDAFWNLVGTVMPSMQAEDRSAKEAELDAETRETGSLHSGHKDNASIWTQLLLAYGVHKSLIFFRVPLTAAVTPKIVKTLRGWGWNIGKAEKRVKT